MINFTFTYYKISFGISFPHLLFREYSLKRVFKSSLGMRQSITYEYFIHLYLVKIQTVEDFDQLLIFTSHLYPIYKHRTIFRRSSKSPEVTMNSITMEKFKENWVMVFIFLFSLNFHSLVNLNLYKDF